jgi:hypothetical protein
MSVIQRLKKSLRPDVVITFVITLLILLGVAGLVSRPLAWAVGAALLLVVVVLLARKT